MEASELAAKRLERAVTRQILRRWTLWSSVAVVAGLYLGMALLAAFGGLSAACNWSLFAMTVVPAWASFIVLVSCAMSFPAERAADTLDALLLTPLSAKELVGAQLRPRLRLGFYILLAGAPFYLMPYGDLGSDLVDHLGHIGVLSTFWRPIIGSWGLSESIKGVGSMTDWWPSLLSGPAALFTDATRLYAFAAIATAVSLNARSVARAIAWTLVFATSFMLITVVAEWLGALLLVLIGQEASPVLLVMAVLLLEAGVGNLFVPSAILAAQIEQAHERLCRD